MPLVFGSMGLACSTVGRATTSVRISHTAVVMATRATQKLRVMHLYRRSLKDLFSWTGNRELFYQEVRNWRPSGGRRRPGTEDRLLRKRREHGSRLTSTRTTHAHADGSTYRWTSSETCSKKTGMWCVTTNAEDRREGKEPPCQRIVPCVRPG